jgi:hypothetical protein
VGMIEDGRGQGRWWRRWRRQVTHGREKARTRYRGGGGSHRGGAASENGDDNVKGGSDGGGKQGGCRGRGRRGAIFLIYLYLLR